MMKIKILWTLWRLWRKYPHMRFAQLVINLAKRSPTLNYPFYMKDEVLLDRANQVLIDKF